MANTKEQVDNLKKLGNDALNAGKFDEAIEYYTQAIGIDSDNHVLWSNRSAVRAKKGDFTNALEDANRTVELAPNWARGYSRKGAALHGLRKYDEAIKAYESGSALEPNNETFKKSIEQVKQDQILESQNAGANFMNQLTQFFSPVVWDSFKNLPQFASFANDPSFLSILSEIQANPANFSKYIQDKRITKYVLTAMKLSTGEQGQPMDFEPQEPPAPSEPTSTSKTTPQKPPEPELTEEQKKALELKDQGNKAYSARNFEEALEFYRKALEVDPSNLSIKLNTTAVFLEQGKYDECIESCEKILEEAREKYADFVFIGKIFGRIGNAYARQEKYVEAIEYYNKSLTENRDPAILKALNNIEQIKEKKDKEAYINPELSLVAKEEGNSHFKAGRFPEAIKSYTEAIKRDPSNPLLLTNRANTYIKLGALPSAIKDCDEALKLDPKLAKAFLRKGQAYLLMKDYSNATKTLDEGLKFDPHNTEMTSYLQKAYMALNGYGDEQIDPNATPEQVLEKAMRNPEVRRILQDPVMKQILEQMATDPAAAKEHLKNPEVVKSIGILRSHGIIR